MGHVPSPKHVILVAGCDDAYLDHPDHVPPIPFYDFCTHRIEILLKKNDKLTFTLFDVKSGNVIQSKLNSQGRRIVHRPFQNYDAITDANYIDEKIHGQKWHHFNQKQENKVISILDIYRFIQTIGGQKETAGSVIEFSIFSHSYEGGPVIVDTNERYEYKTINKRDPQDKDGRRKDFRSENMSETELKQFRDAFDVNGFVWLWGCQFEKGYSKVMSQILKHPKYSANATPNNFANLLNIQFSFSPQEAPEVLEYMNDSFFPPWDKKSQYIFKKNGKDIIDFFKRSHKNTYCSDISKSLKTKCHGAFIGTYADDENKMKKKPPEPLMRIPRNDFPKGKNEKSGVDFTRYINFFTAVLNYEEAPENRGYGTYEEF
jgi:hypothetical protein